MVNREQVQAELRERRRSGWLVPHRLAIDPLPAGLRPIAWLLAGFDAKGGTIDRDHPDWNRRAEVRWSAIRQLETLPVVNRTQIFETLLPKIANHVEAAWQLQKRSLYQTGWRRRSFRAPDHPEVTLGRRGQWLTGLIALSNFYEEDVIWLAQYAGYLDLFSRGDTLGILFAAAIDIGGREGDEVFEILVASAEGHHEIGVMGRHVVQGLLCCSRPEGWEAVERLLLAARRQEGLRQAILETVDEAHPEAFRRMVHLIRQHELSRFSSVVRAVDVWLGLAWEAAQRQAVSQIIDALDDMIQAPERRVAAIGGDDPQAAYLALCALAFDDVFPAIVQSRPLLGHEQVEFRFVAAHFLAQVQLPSSREALAPMLLDEDLRVAATAFSGLWTTPGSKSATAAPALFEPLEEALQRFPARKKQLQPLVWPWLQLTAERRPLADMLAATVGQRSLTTLVPYLQTMSPEARYRLAVACQDGEIGDEDERREFLLLLLGDRSDYVRRSALQAIADLQISEEEAKAVESYLTRKAGDLRRGVLALLLNQADQGVLASAKRLLGQKSALQRRAGLELLRQLKSKKRAVESCLELAEAFEAASDRRPADEQTLLDAILAERRRPATLESGLGLFDPGQCTEPPVPVDRRQGLLRKKPWITPAAVRCLESLDELVHKHRHAPVTLSREGQGQEKLLGNLVGGLFYAQARIPGATFPEEIALSEQWLNWEAERPPDLRDADGLELLRALAPLLAGGRADYFSHFQVQGWIRKEWRVMYGGIDVSRFRYGPVMLGVLWWLILRRSREGDVTLLLDALETSLSMMPTRKADDDRSPPGPGHWRPAWLQMARQHRDWQGESWGAADHIRLWRLLHWLTENGLAGRQMGLHIDEALQAFQAGAATEADLLNLLIGPGNMGRGNQPSWAGPSFQSLRQLSGRKPNPIYSQFAADPRLVDLVERCRQRIVEVELGRGDIPTAASAPALALRYSGGLEVLLRLVKVYSRGSFLRSWSGDRLSKKSVFSHLINTTYPGEADTPQRFVEGVKKFGIGRKRLVELALFAPQWAGHVEQALAWPEFADAVWWFHAHTKDRRWQVEQEIREAWNAQIGERTPLTAQSLLDGAVDVAWFRRVHPALGEKRWRELDRAAKYASGGGGHKRAQLFADAMAGRVGEDELRQRIEEKRHQDAVRALGLLPLPQGREREEAILKRYLIVQEFLLGSRKFGSQRQASEKLAARISLENLARTASFSDPLRLEWAMERQATADLAAGPVSATAGPVTVSLSIDEWGQPQIAVDKDGRRLKSVPRKAKKDDGVAALLARKKELKRQASRTCQSLEKAMCHGHVFPAGELQGLLEHPILKPMLGQLVFTGNGVMGYPVDGGRVLEDATGSATTVGPEVDLRIAHPYDLLETGQWHTWQAECFRRERIQPFKQIFRELYVLTEAEKDSRSRSNRYAGHQINPRQALALLSGRGWIARPEEGISRTFHEAGITAWLSIDGGYFTPADVEGMTLAEVSFSPRGQWKQLELVDVPPRLFSEVMRDIDLVVSVAHQGGVDPESTASTVEMRVALIRETCTLLKIENVRLQEHHALIDGALNSYSVHLGSGVVHQQPGGHVCMVPVHSQHRGRLFLPFMDDDPKTAEILSKVLLLARDKTIKDPTILAQILPVK